MNGYDFLHSVSTLVYFLAVSFSYFSQSALLSPPQFYPVTFFVALLVLLNFWFYIFSQVLDLVLYHF